MAQDILKSQRYPGRNRVLSRDDARDHLWRQRLQLPVANPCTSPFIVHGIGLPSITDRDQSKLPIELEARCRKCDACMRHRRNLWVARAVDEISVSERTWFGTLTVEPHMRFEIECLAEQRLRRGNEYLRDLSPTEQFKYLCDFLGKEVTRWLKRLRKRTKLRYLLVFEPHKDGFPHCHLLLHEPQDRISKRNLESAWKYGFSNWRLVPQGDAKPAWYISKYLVKDSQTRVRASQLYGRRNKVSALTEKLNALTIATLTTHPLPERVRAGVCV